MSDSVLRSLLAAIDRREAVALVTVTATDRSVPRRPGSKMLVFADGSIEGSIGGGEMEARVKADALAALVDCQPRTLSYDLVNPDAGDPGVCGGTVDLYVEPYMPTNTVYVVGAGHVGKSVIELAHWLGYRVVAWDDRAEQLDDVSDADVVVSGSIEEAIAAHPIDRFTRVCMVTRNVALDAAILPALLASPAPVVGLMGSERRWSETKTKLLAAGVDEAAVAKVRTPIGIEIGAETPKEIAVSVLAELIGDLRTTAP